MSQDEIVTRYVRLDRGADKPLYLQVSDGLSAAIGDRHFHAERLPSTRYLAQLLELGVNTIGLAYQELESHGLIYAAPRAGWFVNSENIDHPVPAPSPPQPDTSARWTARLRTNGTPGAPPEVKRSTDDATVHYPFITASLPRESFPVTSWGKASRAAFEGPSRAFSVYDNFGADDPYLIEMILKRILPARGITVGPDNILLTAGTQHALYMLAQSLMAKGTGVAIEDPGYPDARHAFLRVGARLFPVPIDHGGVLIDAIPDAAEILYVTPSHQLPSNVSMSTPRKQRLLRVAQDRGSLIIEDDYDSEMRFVGQASAPIASQGLGNVAYISGFSKYLGAICRIAYIVAQPDLIASLKDIRRYQIRNLSGHEQRTLAHFIEAGSYERQIRSLRRIAKQRWRSCNDLIRELLPDWQVSTSSGGLNLWVQAPDGVDTTALAEALRRHRVAVEPGRVFFADPEHGSRFIKLGFLLLDEPAQRRGLEIIARVTRGLS